MLWSNLEYIPLRVLRRYLFSDRFLVRFGQFIPYYCCSQNQLDPRPIVDRYEKFLRDRGLVMAGKRILEAGVGATNSTGYELSRRFSGNEFFLLEPYVAFAAAADAELLRRMGGQPETELIKSRVHRLTDLAGLENHSIDLILSHSLLEHVAQPREFFQDLLRLLKPDGAMLHIADYRDHFFKYPYHFLQFPKKVWNRYLNPGDLPGWRLGDHLAVLKELGLEVIILDEQSNAAAFAEIRPYMAADYDPEDLHMATTQAVLFVAGKS